MAPISLDDAELDAIMQAAAPLPAEERNAFLQDVIGRLRDQPVGPGSVHRAIVAAAPRWHRNQPRFERVAKAKRSR